MSLFPVLSPHNLLRKCLSRIKCKTDSVSFEELFPIVSPLTVGHVNSERGGRTVGRWEKCVSALK